MEYGHAIEMLQGIAYIRGVLTQWVDDDADVVGICRVIEGRLWDEAERAINAVKKKQEPEQAQKPVDLGDDCISRPPEEHVEVIETKMVPIRDIKQEKDDIVANRPECKKCRYRVKAGTLTVCDYSEQTGKIRYIDPSKCDVWKTVPKKRAKAVSYRHTCKMCGKNFSDGAAGTKWCPECAEVRKRDAEEKRKQIEGQR